MAKTDTKNEPKAAKPNLFAKARGKTAEAPSTAPAKETVWRLSPLPDANDKAILNKAISELHELSAKRKTIEAEEKMHKAVLVDFANGKYCNHVSAFGVEPKSPLKIISDDNKSVTFVVQDRGHLCKVTDEQIAGLAAVIGEKEAEELVVTIGTFEFDTTIMAQKSGDGDKLVSEVVAEEISALIVKLQEKEILSPEQAEGLIAYKEQRGFMPGIVSRTAVICGKSVEKIRQFLDALGSGVTRYIRV